jgi:hypothetical protein
VDRFPAMEWACQPRYVGCDLSNTEMIDENNATDRIFLRYWNYYFLIEEVQISDRKRFIALFSSVP